MDNKITIQNKIQKFIKRLYSIVNDPQNPDITWSNNGTTVLIPSKEKFRTRTMSKISKTKEYTAFLRSLHHYNFLKLKRTDEISDEYYHRYFMKDRDDLLHLVKREKDRKKGVCNEINGLKSDYIFMQNNLNTLNQNFYGMNDEIQMLREKVEKQEQTINGLMEILSKIFRVGISSEASNPMLESNMKEINNLLVQNTMNKEAKRRKIPKLEMLQVQNQPDYSSHEYAGGRSSKIFKNLPKLKLEANRKTSKITEIKSPKYVSMPDLDDLYKKEDSTEEDDYKDLFY